MKADVSFESSGTTCRGWFYPAQRVSGAAPAIVMSHGITAVKEQYLDRYAARFAAEGFAVLAFDFRHLGSSDGTPRGRINPRLQQDDIRAALGWMSERPEVNASRLALWGTSFSGAHAIFVGALDPRVRVVVAQVPAINIPRSLIALIGDEGFANLLKLLVEDYSRRNAGGEGAAIPVVAPTGETSFLPRADAYEWFTQTGKSIAPQWLNHISLESIARCAEYVPDSVIHLVSPKPLLIQAATGDSLIPIELTKEAFAQAGEPKRLEIYECGHFDPYAVEPWHGQFVKGQVDWLKEHL
ncbi:MAG: alpha/beta fold hydrolase [Alphaproteobacteria bacterium]|nr:alpha/beta fold hydrolase [Alphaproteobacteria bacterium]